MARDPAECTGKEGFAARLRLKMNFVFQQTLELRLWPKPCYVSRGSLFLYRFKVSVQISDAHLNLLFMALAHPPEYRTPNWHVLIAMRHELCLPAKNARHFIRGILPAILLGQRSQICRSLLQGAGSRAISLGVLAVTGGAVTHEHFLARSRRGGGRGCVLDGGRCLLCRGSKSTCER